MNHVRTTRTATAQGHAVYKVPQPAPIPFAADCGESGCQSLRLTPRTFYHLPAGLVEMRVTAGAAWLTTHGLDIIIRAGEMLDLTSIEPGALVSGAKGGMTELELFREPPQAALPQTRTQEMRRAFYQRLATHQQLIEVEAVKSW